MLKKIDFGVPQEVEVTGEKISGFILQIGAVQSNGTDVAPIADLNQISIDIELMRSNQMRPTQIFKGYLDDLLTALYSQTIDLALVKAAYGTEYKFKIDFLKSALALNGNDKLLVRVKVNESAFTTLDSGQTGSFINFETVPSHEKAGAIPLVSYRNVGNGDTNVDLSLGDNVCKVVAAMDYSADYWASTKAKFEDGVEISGSAGFLKNVSKNLLESENIHYFDNDADSTVRQLVLFWSNKAIHQVRLRGKLDKAADANAKILVVHKAYI